MADGPMDPEDIEFARSLVRNGIESLGLPYPFIMADPFAKKPTPDWATRPVVFSFPLSKTYTFDKFEGE